MTSPFPGMDPYLEGDLSTTFHIQLTVEIARQLTPRLLPRYFAFANQRQVTDTPAGVSIEATDVYPDVGVVEARPVPQPRAGTVLAEAPVKLKVWPIALCDAWRAGKDAALRHAGIVVGAPTRSR